MSVLRSQALARFMTVAALGLSALLVAAPAQAAPAHDTVATARPVGALPYVDRADTTGATPGSIGGEVCYGNRGSVWYRYTPTRDRLVTVDTRPSDYFAPVSAWVRTDGVFTPVQDGCGVSLTHRFRAGVTYYIQVSDPFNDPLGGSLVFRVRDALAGWAQFDARGTVSRASGDAGLSGHVSCNRTSTVFGDFYLRQRLSPSVIAIGDEWSEIGLCRPGRPLRFSVFLWADGAPFRAGDAAATVYLHVCDNWGCLEQPATRRVVRLTEVRRLLT